MIASSAPNGSSRHSTGAPASSVRSERDALAHAAGELRRAGVVEAGEAEARRAAPCALLARLVSRRRRRTAARARRCRARSSQGSRWSSLGHQHGAGGAVTVPRVRLLQPADELEQRRLAAARRADDRDDLAGSRRQTSPTSQRPDGAEAATHVLETWLSVIAPFAGITPQVQRVSAGDLAQSQPASASPPDYKASYLTLAP